MLNKQSAGWHVYMILTDQFTLYTGIATDVERRLLQHCDMYEGKPHAKGAKYFRGRKPLKIVYTECCQDRATASKRELAIKKLSAARKRQLLKAKELVPA